MAERLRAIWERIRDDIHRNPGLWIGVGITAIVAVIAYLAYRKSTGLDVPANGFGFPDYGAATGGSDAGGGGLGYQPYQPPSSPGNPFNPVTPTAPVSNPFPPFAFAPVSPTAPFAPPAHMIGTFNDQGAPTASFYPIQNPTAAQDQQHRASSLPSLPLPPIQNPTAGQDQQHRGANPLPLPPIQNPTAPSQQAHRRTSHPAQHQPPPAILIPTTKQPITSGHGRAA